MKIDLSKITAYLIPILVALFVVVFFPFFLKPQLDKIKQKNAEVKKSEQRLTVLNEKIADLSKINENDVSLKLLETEKAVPSDKKIPQIILGVNILASKDGLRLQSMEFKPGQPSTESAKAASTKKTGSSSSSNSSNSSVDQQKDKVIFTVTVDGTLQQFKNFLADIESSKRLLGVDKITGKSVKSQTYAFDLEVYAPYKKLQSSGDIVGQELPQFTRVSQSVYDILSKLTDLTNIFITPVETGVTDPFAGH
jgi:Tfp pilus assembly protein PilO